MTFIWGAALLIIIAAVVVTKRRKKDAGSWTGNTEHDDNWQDSKGGSL